MVGVVRPHRVIFVVAVTAMWVVPLAAAELLITLSRPRWRLFFRAALIVPLAFSPVIQVLTWQFIYDPNVGVLNDSSARWALRCSKRTGSATRAPPCGR